MEPENLISIQDAAKNKGVCRQSIYNAIKAGTIKVALEIGGKKLLDREELAKYKPRRKKSAKEPSRNQT